MIIKGGIGGQSLTGTASGDLIYGGDSSDPSALTGAITVSLFKSGLSRPLFATSAPSDSTGLYVVEQAGAIQRVDTLTGAKTSFLTIGNVGSVGERGALSVAFHPDYATNGRFFVYVTNSGGDIEVREYARNGASGSHVANATPVQTLLTIEHSARSNHNGGSMAFSPTNGLLYIGVGDGGGGGDPDHNGQNPDTLLGKILRIDVNSDDFPDPARNYHVPATNPFVGVAGADEIFAMGVRNPWRMSFDASGNLWIGDVGQNAREEVDFIATGSNGGQNFGWNNREGAIAYPGGDPLGPGTLTSPIYNYTHAVGEAITGGYVYSGAGAGLQGKYVFGDFSSGRVFALEKSGASVKVVDVTASLSQSLGPYSIASFGQDTQGNLYVTNVATGNVYRLSPQAGAGDGNDTINGGAGADTIYGGLGEDRLYGGGENDFLYGGVGADTLHGGEGADQLRGAAGNDAYVIDNASDKVIESSGAGTDRIITTISATLAANVEHGVLSGSANLNLTGNTLANALSGNTGANILNGGGGNDALNGGLGLDTLTGGAGADAFLFNTAPSAANADRIMDFNPADDWLRFENAIFTALGAPGALSAVQFRIGAAAADANDHLIYNSATGALYYDSNGNAPGGVLQVATLARGLALTHLDFNVF